MRAAAIVQRGLRTPTGPLYARCYTGIIRGSVAMFVFMGRSTKRMALFPPHSGSCSTGLHFLTILIAADAGAVGERGLACGAICTSRSGIERSSSIIGPASAHMFDSLTDTSHLSEGCTAAGVSSSSSTSRSSLAAVNIDCGWRQTPNGASKSAWRFHADLRPSAACKAQAIHDLQ